MRKVFVPLAVLAVLMLVASLGEAQQRKNRAGGDRPAGPGPGGPNGPGGPGGPSGPLPIGQILPPFLQERLQLTPEQQQQLEALQKEVDQKLANILNAEQNRTLQEMRQRGPGGFGPPGGPDGGFGGPPGGGPGGGRQRSPIGAIMAKLGSPRGSLTQLIGQELKQPKPAWDTIQTQTQEYAQRAADLAKYDPPRGSKQSWSKLTSAFASSAAALEKAAQAKDKKAATAAHTRLANSCMSCHRTHRAMGPGGGPGGPPPGGF